MAEVKITDLVPQETIDKIKELNSEMQNTLATYTNVARDLAKGIDVPVKGLDDLEKLQNLLAQKSKEAAASTEQLNRVVTEQREVIANTTNTISRQLMEQERVNKTQREAYTEHERVKRLLDQYHDTYENQVQSLVRINQKLDENKKAQKDNEKQLSMGRISMQQFTQKQAELIAQHRSLTQEKRTLTQIMTAEEKAAQSNEGSYVHMSQQLELLKKAYKDLSEEGRNSDFGKELEATIQNLDAHLKDTAADMGEFQRNVGNYAIAGQNGVVSTESLIAVMQQEARTQQDLVDQTKILEEAKLMLNKNDENYQSTLDKLNAKLEDNKKKLTDVSDIIGKEANSVSEAEAQNKRLSEAIKHIDLKSADAKQRLEEMRAQIERNNDVIGEATGKNEEFADSVLGLIGVNADFGSSLQSLGSGGNFLDGLNTKVKAFGSTLMGLLANPWVLAFLGIAGVAAGAKWWYDYNKGLVEATKRTKDFTGLTGDELKAVRNEVQGVSDMFGKDFNETLEAANALSKQFGISIQEALRLMEDGFIAGADVNGEFLENIKEYPAYFREAGISASEFIAITTQANQAGIYSDKGIDVIKEGNIRIREMTKATASALDGIGISSKQVVKDLTDGSKTTFDVMKEVSAKLAEYPETAPEVGAALADIFGGPGEDAGLQYITMLKETDTNLDNVKGRAGELGELQEEQMRSQVELENVISAVFDKTGGSFESMTTKAKTYVNEGLIAIIKGCVDIANWFIRMYNKSMVFRGGVNAIGNAFKIMWEIAKFAFNQIIDSLKAAGGILEGVFTMNWDMVEQNWSKGVNAFGGNIETMIKNIASNTAQAWNNTMSDELDEFSVDLKPEKYTGNSGNGNSGGGKGTGNKGSQTDEEKKATAQAAQEQLKILEQLEDAKIQAMADGHDKEIELIKQKYKQKIDAITGNSKDEEALRIQLIQQMNAEIADYELKYQQNLAKINLENRLAIVEEGSKEELTLKLARLEAQRAAELEEAEKTGADVNLINEKFNKEREEMQEEYADKRMSAIEKEFAEEAETRNTQHILAVADLQNQYAKELAAAGESQSKRKKAEKKFLEDMRKLEDEYAKETAENTIKMYEDMLKDADLSLEARMEVERKLAAAKAELAKLLSDIGKRNSEGTDDPDPLIPPEILDRINRIAGAVADLFSSINDLSQNYFDAQIERIETLQEANTEAGEAEQERITELVEKKVITEEEGEARKRAAEAKTAKKNEELEKKKQQLKIKQAKWDKANSIAQATISTALAIMNALNTKPFWLGIAMAAIAGAMGAVQIATIAAQPIPAYAKGTDYHKGGPAIVGDGGQSEVVMFNGKAWMTPDKPTLVDIPKGAEVIPSVNQYENLVNVQALPPMPEKQIVVSGYNDRDMRRCVGELAALIKQNTKERRAIAYCQEYELFKVSRGL